MNKLSLDLIICTYNRADSLLITLRSLENLEVPEHLKWSVLVINNNCTDHTSDILKSFTQSSKIQLSSFLETKQGLTEARRTGLVNSNSEWIAFIDDDCILDKTWLVHTAGFIQKNPYIGAFGGKIVLEFDNYVPDYVNRIKYAYAGKSLGDKPFKKNWVAGLGMTIRKEVLLRTGWVEKPYLLDRIGNKLISGGDMEIGIRIAQNYEVWYTPEPMIKHIIPATRTSKEYIKKMLWGLGASRHNVVAITWKKSYMLFIGFEIFFFIGSIGINLFEAFRELFFEKSRLGLNVLLQTSMGWLDASIQLYKSRKDTSEFILGKANHRNH